MNIHRVYMRWTISIDSLHHFMNSQCEIHTIQQRKCLKCHKRHVNDCKFQWFWSNHCIFSMVFEESITIECFLAVWALPPMVFQWFLILLPSLSMVFDGSGPLVKRCDGFDGSLWSTKLTKILLADEYFKLSVDQQFDCWPFVKNYYGAPPCTSEHFHRQFGDKRLWSDLIWGCDVIV